MKIAVTYDNGQIFQHFGHTEQFKLYDVEDGTVTAQTVVDAGGEGHGALAQVLKAHGVDTLICRCWWRWLSRRWRRRAFASTGV